MKRSLAFLLSLLLVLAPGLVLADGLVPCGDPDQPGCQTCDVMTLIDNVFDWLVAFLFTVLSIMIVVSGIRIVTAQGNQSTLQSAKSMIFNAIIGYAIILAAWMLMDLLLKTLLVGGEVSIGPWDAIQCVQQPVMLP